jgi:dihydropteroate synthase
VISSNQADLRLIKQEMERIGVSEKGRNLMLKKASFWAIEVEKVSFPAANILKQQMLSLGGEVCLKKEVIVGEKKKSNLLILGNQKQLEELAEKIASQPFGLKEIGRKVKEVMIDYSSSAEKKIKWGTRELPWGRRTLVMGILNVTPDSFSDGGCFLEKDKAIAQGMKMVEEGADLIDIGGESSRPGAKRISDKEEKKRILPVLSSLRKKTKVLISVDTYKSSVAEAAIKEGADLINDISALRFDPKLKEVIAKYQVPVVLMHMKGTPRTMQKNPSYQNLIAEMIEFLRKQIEVAEKSGISREKVIVDPGIGFGKTVAHNLEIIRRLREFKSLGRPVLLGPSRKSFIGLTLNLPVSERLEGTLATLAYAVAQGVDLVRVHDVKEAKRIIKMTEEICHLLSCSPL